MPSGKIAFITKDLLAANTAQVMDLTRAGSDDNLRVWGTFRTMRDRERNPTAVAATTGRYVWGLHLPLGGPFSITGIQFCGQVKTQTDIGSPNAPEGSRSDGCPSVI